MTVETLLVVGVAGWIVTSIPLALALGPVLARRQPQDPAEKRLLTEAEVAQLRAGAR